MKLYTYLRFFTRRRSRSIPNAAPLMLWTRETGAWREIVVNPNRNH